jgi:hypothetical protein
MKSQKVVSFYGTYHYPEQEPNSIKNILPAIGGRVFDAICETFSSEGNDNYFTKNSTYSRIFEKRI